MSLEDKLEALTKAVVALTAKMDGKAPASGSTKPKPTGKKKTTVDAVAKAFGAYLSAEGDAAKKAVRSINKHFDVKRVSEIDEDRFDEALELLKGFEAGENPLDDDDGGESLM